MDQDKDLYHHHPFLEAIALHDVEFLKEKDRSYGASWKKRGGVGVFMMLARKWDRLENTIKELGRFGGGEKDAPSYDLLKWIAAESNTLYKPGHYPTPGWQGRDGTVLAEVRDLRRYLLLVEAELVARRAIALDGPEPSNERLVPRFESPGARPEHLGQGTPEDGGHHAVARTDLPRIEDGEERPPAWSYIMVRLDSEGPNGSTIHVTYYNADRARIPSTDYDHLPELLQEVNAKELSELQPYYRPMYEWSEAETKYRLRPEYREHWGRQP